MQKRATRGMREGSGRENGEMGAGGKRRGLRNPSSLREIESSSYERKHRSTRSSRDVTQ